MNERIRELAKQADEKFSCEYNGDYTVFNKEKFAELIVRECADAIELNTMQIPKRSISEIRTILRKHFGVEQ